MKKKVCNGLAYYYTSTDIMSGMVSTKIEMTDMVDTKRLEESVNEALESYRDYKVMPETSSITESYIIEKVDAMIEARKVANKIASEREKAIAYHDTVAPLMEDIRYHVDKLETIVDDEAWPLPKYRELLFIR